MVGCRGLTPLCPQLADVVDSEVLQVYMKPPAHEESRAPSKGFVVRDAPWTASSSEKVGLLGAGGGGVLPGRRARAVAVPSLSARLLT